MSVRGNNSIVSEIVRSPDSHAQCMVCGRGRSLGLRFGRSGEWVKARVSARLEWQGYQGILHGGMISTLLDAAMTHVLFDQGVEAVTANLNVRFLKAVPCAGTLVLRARLLGKRRHLYHLVAELSVAGDLLARAEAKFIPRS